MHPSIIKYIDADTLLAELILSRAAQPDHSFCALEGPDDWRLMRRFASSQCELLVCWGKGRVLSFVEGARANDIAGVVGIVDQDMDGPETSDSIFSWDQSDLESFLLTTSAFESVLFELGSPAKIHRLGVNQAREKILEAAKKLGKWRRLSLREGWAFDFKDLNYRQFVCDKTLSLDGERLIEILRSRGWSECCSLSDIVDAIREKKCADYTNGHDLIHICACALLKILGTNSAGLLGNNSIPQLLRSSVGLDEFSHSDIYVSLRAWEAYNAPYLLLAA